MKRIGNLYEKICSIQNLELADAIARKGKGKQYGVQVHDQNREANILALHESLINRTYCTSQYTTFKVFEPKERIVFRLPYYPDRIVHHAIMNLLEPIFISVFTADTYSCIKGKGIHAAAMGVKRALKDETGTTYCLKLDIKKFYPSIDHSILKQLLRKKIKDQDLLWLLDEIIDSAAGLPIGNYLSQYFANFYLTYFDHWLKEVKQVRYYFRYADDLVILHHDKAYLHSLLSEISEYLKENLNLTVKQNYQVFPVAIRGIDFIGYRFFPKHTLLRKSIKQNFARMLARRPNKLSIASYYGWCCHADCRHLLKTLLSNERIQRIQHNHNSKKFLRRQNKDRPDIKPGDRGNGLQDRKIPV
jgi:RNA-directed DNA polymerase